MQIEAKAPPISRDSSLPRRMFAGPAGDKLWRRVASALGIDPDMRPRFLGYGDNGDVFQIGPVVLKLTIDKSEARASAILAVNPEPTGAIVRIEEIVEVGGLERPVWAILMEDLDRVPPRDPVRRYVRWWGEYVQYAPSPFVHPDNVEEFVNFAEASHDTSTQPAWPAFVEWLKTVATYLKARGIDFSDLHVGNVMKRGEQTVLIDLGKSDVKRAPKITTVSRLLALAAQIEAAWRR